MAMEWGRRLAWAFATNKDNVVHVLLIGAFAAIGARSVAQQAEIDSLEAEKQSLRCSNRAMQKSMWEWRQSLHALYESDPSSSPISLSKLRAIYGEDQPQEVASVTYPGSSIPYVSTQQEDVTTGESGNPNTSSTTIAV